MTETASAARVVIRCRGHANIRGSHGKTIEVTEDETVTSAGTCIVGVGAEIDADSLLQLRGPIRVHLRCGGETDVVMAETNPVFRRGDPLIIRKRGGSPPRTFAVNADKAAIDLNRDLIQALQQRDAELTVEVEEIASQYAVAGGLFVIGTPIGNPDDFTRRAIDVLGSVDVILAEDTRTARKQLSALGLSTRIKSCHEQNERSRTAEAIELLSAGKRIALISEAGVPTLSDPGYHIVDAALEAGIVVTPVPGPSAITAALSVSGLATADVRFVGFLPRKRQARRRALEDLKDGASTLVFFEAPHRILAALGDIAQVMGERQMTLCRDMTKPRETVWRAQPAVLIERLSEEDPPRGEFTLVVEGLAEMPGQIAREGSVDAFVASLIDAGCATKMIANALAAATGISKREAFADVVRLKEQRSDGQAAVAIRRSKTEDRASD